MKRKLFLVLLAVVSAFCLVFGLSACSNNGNTETSGDSLEYALSEDETFYYVASIGTCTDTEIEIPETYNNKPIKSIGEGAFFNCTFLKSITIPDSVTSIEYGAFYYCTSLTSVSIGNSVTNIERDAFSGCESLKDITIPDSVTSIGNAFENSPIENVTMPALAISNMPKINLKTVIITNGESISNRAFYNCSTLTSITLPNSVTSIGDYAFYLCTSLTSVTMDGVTSIGEQAFYGCSELTNVNLPDSLTSMGNSAFSYCTSITSIVIPDGITIISQAVFNQCYALKSVTIPDSVTVIAYYAFAYCNSITSINYKGDIKSWCSIIGLENLLSYGSTDRAIFINNAEINSESEIVLPDNVTSIERYAFCNFTSLTKITIPVSVTSIGAYVFNNCSTLTTIIYNGTVEEWRAITKDAYWDGRTGSYSITCTDGTLVKN
ncbi:MAG: leucine-rich repeat domain-containing protein [Candidatus Coproplasma sp.]